MSEIEKNSNIIENPNENLTVDQEFSYIKFKKDFEKKFKIQFRQKYEKEKKIIKSKLDTGLTKF